jgi:hypothetical protein
MGNLTCDKGDAVLMVMNGSSHLKFSKGIRNMVAGMVAEPTNASQGARTKQNEELKD